MSFAMQLTSKDTNTIWSISMTTYIIPPTVLYIKQHSVTGLKYFGKTTAKDPYKYQGSGKYWVPHIKKHGKGYVITLWVSEPYTDSIVISEFALSFSKEHNIVESKDWANIKPENGLDGGGNKGKTHSTETKQKISAARKGKPLSAEHIKKISDAKKGKPRSTETRQKMSDGKKGKPSRKKGIPSGKKGIPTGKPSPLKGKPSPLKGKPSPLKGKPSGKKGIPTRPHSDETKQKLSDAWKTRKPPSTQN